MPHLTRSSQFDSTHRLGAGMRVKMVLMQASRGDVAGAQKALKDCFQEERLLCLQSALQPQMDDPWRSVLNINLSNNALARAGWTPQEIHRGLSWADIHQTDTLSLAASLLTQAPQHHPLASKLLLHLRTTRPEEWSQIAQAVALDPKWNSVPHPRDYGVSHWVELWDQMRQSVQDRIEFAAKWDALFPAALWSQSKFKEGIAHGLGYTLLHVDVISGQGPSTLQDWLSSAHRGCPGIVATAQAGVLHNTITLLQEDRPDNSDHAMGNTLLALKTCKALTMSLSFATDDVLDAAITLKNLCEVQAISAPWPAEVSARESLRDLASAVNAPKDQTSKILRM